MQTSYKVDTVPDVVTVADGITKEDMATLSVVNEGSEALDKIWEWLVKCWPINTQTSLKRFENKFVNPLEIIYIYYIFKIEKVSNSFRVYGSHVYLWQFYLTLMFSLI